MSLLVPPRRPSRELLDDPSLPPDEMARNLADIAKLDERWGGSRALTRWLVARLAARGERKTSVLDLGAGLGEPTRRLRRGLGGAGVTSDVFALDLQWRHLAAGKRIDGGEPVPGLAADAFRLPLKDAAVDWIVSTLLLHHFSPEQLTALFGEMRRTARRGFALLDLSRHLLPLAFVKVAGRFVFASPVSIHDGIASIRQAYTREELLAIVRRTAPGARVEGLFPFRLLVTAEFP